MKLRFSQRERQTKASPALMAVVLLVLTGHAFVVGTSHFHRGRASAADAVSARAARLVAPAAAQSTPLSGQHEQCLLCRLQRNLVAELQHAAPALGTPRAVALAPDGRSDLCLPQASPLAPSGRAPPSA